MRLLLLSAIFAVFFFSACRKKPHYPDTPQISSATFTSEAGAETGELNFYFTDGDGDIGLSESSTEFNVHLLYYQRDALGNIVTYDLPNTIDQDSLKLDYRISDLHIRPGAIQGYVQIDIYKLSIPHPQEFWFDIVLTDKAGHVSNTLRTSAFQFN